MVQTTIALPTLNEEEYIEECLSSLQNCVDNYQDKVEVLLIDSHSSDRTVEIAENHDLVDKVVFEEEGILRARHRAFIEAEGDVVVSVDADTLYEDDFLNHLLKPLENEMVVMTYGRALEKKRAYGLGKEILQNSLPLIGLDWVSGSNRAVRKSKYFESGGYDLSRDSNSLLQVIIEEQVLFPLRMSQEGEVKYVPSALCYQSPRTLVNIFNIGEKDGGRPWKLVKNKK